MTENPKRLFDVESRIIKELNNAKWQAWNALSRYKFSQFGYWAAWWVKLNKISNLRKPNPFKTTVILARSNKSISEAKP